MGEAHGHALHFHGHSVIHRVPAHAKVVALISFMVLVVATPWHLGPMILGEALLLGAVIAASRVPFGYLLRRAVVEVPFVVFAVLMPFVAAGPRVEILGTSVSRNGLESGCSLLVKGTLGVFASLTLAATTEPRDLLVGLRRLRVPSLLVEIAGFMVRYLEVIAGEMARMRIARSSRGFTARHVTQWPVLARSCGALFIRSYERGERVHLAMLSRGYTGSLPPPLRAGHPEHPRNALLPDKDHA